MFSNRAGNGELRNGCLSFFVLDGHLMTEAQESVERAPGDKQPALTYSLETGRVCFRNPTDGSRSFVDLRAGSRLLAWEPMTPEKFELMAIELGIVGHPDAETPLAIFEPDIAAITVSPDGHVFHRDRSDYTMCVSDVLRLSDSPAPLWQTAGPQWSKYSYEEDVPVSKYGEPVAARVGSGIIPVPDRDHFQAVSLAECSAWALVPLEETDNRTVGPYSDEAAAFVRDNFGVDTAAVKSREAAKARYIGNFMTHDLPPFDPIPACGALRLASQNATPLTPAHQEPGRRSNRQYLTPGGEPSGPSAAPKR